MRRATMAAVRTCMIVACWLGAGAPATGEGGNATFDPANFGLGPALTVTLDGGDHDRVDSAELVNGLVRVTKESNTQARLMLEGHYFFETEKRKFFGVGNPQNYAWGPFIALQPSDDELIDAVGAGLLVSFRKCISKEAKGGQDDDCGAVNPASRAAFNLGIGVVVDPNARILGDDIEANQPLPPGETEIRFKETDQWGILLLFSVSI